MPDFGSNPAVRDHHIQIGNRQILYGHQYLKMMRICLGLTGSGKFGSMSESCNAKGMPVPKLHRPILQGEAVSIQVKPMEEVDCSNKMSNNDPEPPMANIPRLLGH